MRPVFKSKNELVYAALKDAILHGDPKPGQRLVIDDLAVSMGVSPIPIREALRQLEADGLVSITPYSGATVTAIHAGLIGEVFSLLQSLEIISSRAACPLISPEDLIELETQIHDMDAMVSDPERWSEANRRLHLFICRCAKTTLVASMMRTAFDHWDRLRRHYLQDVFANRIAVAQQDHHAILAALARRDPDAVEHVMREHNQRALAAYMQPFQPIPPSPPGGAP